jgi:hypothetical protein
MVLEIANITKDRKDLYELLDQAYAAIYTPAFPNPDSRESLEKFKKAIEGGIPKVQIAVNILGENLLDPATRVIKGISIAYYYEPQNVGMLAYNAIDPNHREAGLGKLMVESRIDSLKKLAHANGGQQLAGVFIDVNDPAKVAPEDDSMDPSKRIAIFGKWGAHIIPIDYVQPPLSLDGYYCDTMRLMNYPIDGVYADKKVIESFLRALYREYRSDLKPDDDYYFQQMKSQLKTADLGVLIDNDTVPGYKMNVPKYNYV